MTDADDTRFLSPSEIATLKEGEVPENLDWSEPADVFTNIPMSNGQFPAGLVPASIEAYARNKAERIGTLPGPIACSLIVAAAQAIPHSISISPDKNQRTWEETPQLWLGISGPASANKSIGPKVASGCFKEREDAYREAYKQDFKAYMNDMDQHKALVKIWNKECSDLIKKGAAPEDLPRRPMAPEMPVLKRNLLKDATIEKLVDICASNPNGVLQIEDELTRMLGAMGAYSGTASRDQGIYNTAYGGERDYTVDRMSRTVFVPRLAVCLVGAITEDALRSLFKGKPRDGFLARFLFARSDSVPVVPGEEDPALVKRVHKTMKAIMDMGRRDTPSVFTLSDEANAIRENLRNWGLAVNSLPTTGEMTREHIGKWGGLFSRLCLVFQVYENAEKGFDQFENTVIGADVARRVERLLKTYFLPEAVRVYTDVLGDASSETSEHVAWIAGWILSGQKTKFSLRDLGREYRAASKMDQRQFQQVMTNLEVAGWITKVSSAKSRIGMEWSRTQWDVNPFVHDTFARRAEEERRRRQEIQRQIVLGSKAVKELGE